MSFWLSQGPSYPWNPSRKNTNRIPSRKTRNGQRATDDINCTIFWRVVECSILLRLVNYCSLSMEISRNFGILQFGIPQSWRITWRITRRTPQVHHTAQERNWWDRNLLATCEELTQLCLYGKKHTKTTIFYHSLNLPGWWFGTCFFSIIYWEKSFPLTNSYFSRWLKPPTSYNWLLDIYSWFTQL